MSWEMWASGSEDEDPMNDDEASEYAHEEDLRERAEHETLGGVDLDHCQRIRD